MTGYNYKRTSISLPADCGVILCLTTKVTLTVIVLQLQLSITYHHPQKKPSKWRALKTTSPEIETFLNNVERDLFKNTKRRFVKDNLSVNERKCLNQWRKENLFSPDSTIIMHQQDKGNRFVIVEKEIDVKKANEQIELGLDWNEKWFQRGKLTNEWKESECKSW